MAQRIALLLLSGALVATPSQAQHAATSQRKAVAHNLVTSALLTQGQTLLISGSVRDAPLMEDLAIEAAKVGLQPVLSIWSERLIRRSYDDVPAKYDSQEQTLGLAMAKLFDGQIAIDFGETEGLLKGVPPERIAAAGERVRTAFAGGKTVQLTHPNGTSLTFDVTDRTPTISTGALTEAQVKQGGAALLTWLPAGEFQVAAVPGSAEGKIVIDKSLWRGQVIRGLTLVFSHGKLTSMTAASGVAPLKADFDAAGPGKDLFGVIDIGLNPGLNVPLATGAIVWPQAGAVSIVLGNDTVAGGSNNSDFGYAGQLAGASVSVDGKAVVERGRLK